MMEVLEMKAFLKAISFVLTAAMLSATLFSAAARKPAESADLRFGNDGKFTILQFADAQDDALPRRAMLMLMEAAIKETKPDLIVLTGDNTGVTATKLESKLAINAMLKPIIKSGVPFTFCFGNHDAEKVPKEYQLGIYSLNPSCLAYDAEPELTGCATHNLEIKSSDGARTAFNIWMIDSNMYADGGYDHVHQDQIDWYVSAEAKLRQANGGVAVPSMVFQHICVPEIYEVLKDAPEGFSEVTKIYNGTPKLRELNPDMASGVIGEWPCPPNTNSGEFAQFVETGDVVGIVTGHDHINSFVGTYQGIDFIQTQGIGFQTYGNELRGFRVITLNEGDTDSPYSTYTRTFYDLFGDDTAGQFMYLYYGSEIASLLPPFVGRFLTDFVRTDIGEKVFFALKSLFD